MTADLGQYMQQLYQQFGGQPGVVIELHRELLAVRVSNQAAIATVFLQGAQISHYQRQGEKPLIWCSDYCNYSHGTPLRGGIPICWPWFGDLKRNSQELQQQIPDSEGSAPAHGFARNRQWQLQSVNIIDPQTTELVLDTEIDPNETVLWPYACKLTMTILVGETLELSFEVTNKDQQSFRYTSALHSYFAISDIAETHITGLEGESYLDCMDDWQAKVQQGPIHFNQETDRLYQGQCSDIQIHDSQRRISLLSQNSRSAVVWNPWTEKAKNLSHFGLQDYRRMVCVETANAGEDAVTLKPGESHRLNLVIR